MQYRDFATIYDRLMDDFDYPAWAEHYLTLIRRMGGTARRVGECGCGTGSLSVELAKRGVQLVSGDISEDMLRLAGEKARKNGLMIPFVRQDMRHLLHIFYHVCDAKIVIAVHRRRCGLKSPVYFPGPAIQGRMILNESDHKILHSLLPSPAVS